jgi:hypothetical protein
MELLRGVWLDDTAPRLLDQGDAAMRGNWDWDIVPESIVEWIGFSVALVVVLVAAWWISQ